MGMASRRSPPARNGAAAPARPAAATPATPAPATPAPTRPGPATPAAGAAPPAQTVPAANTTPAHIPSVIRPPIPPPPVSESTQNLNKFIIITERETYDQLLIDVGRKHLLVEFFAPWCGACMLINKTLEELATAYVGKLIIAKVNVEECEQIAIDNGVTMMPAFMLVKEKKVLEKFAGSNEEKLISIIKKFIGEPIVDNEETLVLGEVPQSVSTTAAATTPQASAPS